MKVAFASMTSCREAAVWHCAKLMALSRMQKRRGLLNLEPEYQRGFVWDITASSRLVETILLGLPVPEVCSHASTIRDYQSEICLRQDPVHSCSLRALL